MGSASKFVCPECRSSLREQGDRSSCSACGVDFPAAEGIVDFSQGRYFDEFSSDISLPAEALEGLADEVIGTRARILDFYLPRLDKLRLERGPEAEPLKILDCGCGNGLSVDLLTDAGYSGWGNDLSLLRKWQWRERKNRERLFVCSGSRLPFPDEFFDVIISSGVLEHVGVTESSGPPYSVRPNADKREARQAFLAEVLRVLSPAGRLWLDFPNGNFPIDFWHTTGGKSTRFHSLTEEFLPSVKEVRECCRALSPELRLKAASPAGRLQLRRVRRRWYGKLLYFPVVVWFRLLRLPFIRLLAGSFLNPYLVLEITRHRASKRV